jgi:hypothetical protein
VQYRDKGYYTSALLDDLGVFHGFGTRKFVLATLVESGLSVPHTKQVHGTDFHFFQNVDKDELYVGDAFFTDQQDIACYVRTADCLPLLMFDKKRRIVGAIHCGWRGIAEHIVKKTISSLIELGSNSKDIVVVGGPRIKQKCYSVGSELVDGFKNNGWKYEDFILKKNGNLHFDLFGAVHSELISCGIPKNQIEDGSLCTFCEAKSFYSYRRHPSENDRQISFIALMSDNRL